MNTYILQKDLPDAKAGTKYIQKDPQLTDFYFSGAGSNYRPEVVENNPEWFRKEPEPKEKIKVLGFYHSVVMPMIPYENLTVIATDGSIKEIISERYSNIAQAFEDILNDRFSQKEYAERDMRLCFLAGRSALSKDSEWIYKNFDEYMNLQGYIKK